MTKNTTRAMKRLESHVLSLGGSVDWESVSVDGVAYLDAPKGQVWEATGGTVLTVLLRDGAVEVDDAWGRVKEGTCPAAEWWA